MRNTMLVLLTLAAVTAATAAMAEPPPGYDYPWCAQGRGPGYPGECMYSTRDQCLAAASGRGLDCNLNPRIALGQQPARRKGSRNPREY